MIKQAIVVRTDLGMSKGKIAGQVAHAAVMTADIVRKYCPEWYNEWLHESNPPQTKIVLRIDSYDLMFKLHTSLGGKKLYNYMIYDAGKTQLEPNTPTCLGIGPAPAELIDPIIKDLKLL